MEAALQAAIHMSTALELQELLLQRNVLAHVVPLLLEYDTTTSTEEAGPQILSSPGDSASRLPHIFQLPMQRSNVQVCVVAVRGPFLRWFLLLRVLLVWALSWWCRAALCVRSSVTPWHLSDAVQLCLCMASPACPCQHEYVIACSGAFPQAKDCRLLLGGRMWAALSCAMA